ncbi:hypothetical protein RSAG8_06689, partial [Rhizoctonia solani AG-8 WAC10335]
MKDNIRESRPFLRISRFQYAYSTGIFAGMTTIPASSRTDASFLFEAYMRGRCSMKHTGSMVGDISTIQTWARVKVDILLRTIPPQTGMPTLRHNLITSNSPNFLRLGFLLHAPRALDPLFDFTRPQCEGRASDPSHDSHFISLIAKFATLIYYFISRIHIQTLVLSTIYTRLIM